MTFFMQFGKPVLAVLAAGTLLACTPVRYTEPSASGLMGERPYPGPQDVCQVNSETDAGEVQTIVCPAHERGAIADRVAEGAVQVTQVGRWVVLKAPPLR